MITRELGKSAFANISDIVSWTKSGNLIITPSESSSPDVLAAIVK